jgi:protease-4
LTGSIGVVTAKPVLEDAYARLRAHRYALQRGANADLYTGDAPWRGEQRQKVEEGVVHVYSQFKQRVAASRDLALDQLDNIANGRVWTGAQAHDLGLVDAVGDFQVAVNLACEAANLPVDGTVAVSDLTPPKQRLLAEPGQVAKALLDAAHTPAWQSFASLLMPCEWSDPLVQEHYWLIADNAPRV